MIEHVDLQNSGSFGKSAGEPNISFARCRISRGMVVHEHESISRLADYRPKDVARMSQRFVDASSKMTRRTSWLKSFISAQAR